MHKKDLVFFSDTDCDLRFEEVKKYEMNLIYMPVYVEGEEYKIDLEHKGDFADFYKEKLRTGEALNLPLAMIYAMKARGWEFYKNHQELLNELEKLVNEY